MSLVPVIDLAPAAAGEAGRRQVAAAVAAACERVGFLVVTGHGVPAGVIDGGWAAARAFFDLDEAAKRAVAMPHPGYPYGYSPVAGESLARSLGDHRPPDLKESFSIGPADLVPPPAVGGEAAEFAWAANLWPAAPPGFRDAMLAYYQALSGLAGRLMRLFALGLTLPEDFFDSRIDRAISALRLLNYPDQAVPPG